MFNLIKSWYDKLFPKSQPKFELSIRGEYFYDYCVEIVKGNNPYIAAYEEKLTYITDRHPEMSRLMAAAACVQTINELTGRELDD